MDTQESPKFGWLLDPEDATGKDRALSATSIATSSVQDEIDLSCYFKPVSQQMKFPSCTANACADAWEAMSIIDKVDSGLELQTAIGITPDLSRMFLWWCGRNEMDPNRSLDSQSGCHNRLIMDVLSRFGVPSEDLWPYDDAQVGSGGEPRSIVRPSLSAFRAAIVNASGAYYSVKETGEDRHNLLLQAIGAKHLPVFGTAVTQSFLTYTDGVVSVPSESGPFAGLHAMVISGWSTALQAYKVRNSWGEGWGRDGYCWLAKNYVLSSVTDSIWVATKGVL